MLVTPPYLLWANIMWKLPGALPAGYQDWLQVTLPGHQSPVMEKCSLIIYSSLSSCISHLPPSLHRHTCSNTSRFLHDASQHRFAKSFRCAISFQSMGGCVPCCSLTLVIVLGAMRGWRDGSWVNKHGSRWTPCKEKSLFSVKGENISCRSGRSRGIWLSRFSGHPTNIHPWPQGPNISLVTP